MSDGHMIVTFGAIENGATDTEAVAAQIDQQLDDLKSYLAPLVASWSGDASADYQAAQAKWDASAADLNQVLKEIAANLRTANQNYGDAERSNASMWGT